MGHRRLAGLLSEQNVGGAAFIRIDVPSTPPVTQLYAPGAVYAITPCTEDVARAVAAKTRTDPVSLLGIDPRLPAASAPMHVDDDYADDDDDADDDGDDGECPHGLDLNLDCQECIEGRGAGE
jgi:hypothetical protein